MARTALYRHFNKDGVLLYVGITLRVIDRLAQHSNQSCWYDQIAYIKVEYFETRDEAIKAEQLVIVREKPLFNKQFNPEARKDKVAVVSKKPRTPVSRCLGPLPRVPNMQSRTPATAPLLGVKIINAHGATLTSAQAEFYERRARVMGWKK